MKNIIPLSVPNLKGNEKKYVLDAINKEWVSTQGEYIVSFEKYLAQYINLNSTVACQSGTAGLHLSLILLNVTSEDMVIVPTLTFIAAVNPIRYIGAEPIFIDCDDYLTIDTKKLKEFCSTKCYMKNNSLINMKTGKKIKALIVVHTFGNLANMEEILDISKMYNLKVIEDATEALGSKFISGKLKDKHAGTIGDIGVYSFNGNKIVTSGGGGALVSNSNMILEKARYLSTQAKDDGFKYIHNEVGFNYRMTNIQAAVGLGQLEQLDDFIKIKKENYIYYKNKLCNLKDFSLLNFRDDIEPNYWFYSLLINENFKIEKDELMDLLLTYGIQTRPVWALIHKQKPYINCEAYKIEKAYYYQKYIINIPCSTNLNKSEIDYIIDKLYKLS